MKSILTNLKKGLYDTALVFRREMSLVSGNVAVLIFFVVLPLLYPIAYTLIYNPEVVDKVPVAVVDDSRSVQSREFIRQASATPQFAVYDVVPNMADAKKLWAERKVYAIIHIPRDYATKLARGQQTNVAMHCDMSLLLRYRSLLTAATALQLKLAQDITTQRVERLGAQALGVGGLPVESECHFLGDTQQGFASFVIPGIVVLILQQSMILGIGLLGGASRERRRQNGGRDPLSIEGASLISTVWGKSLCYTVIYIPMAIYVLHYIPVFFHLPHYGDPVDYLLLIFPLLLASSFLGQAIVVMIREREYVFLVVVFTSIIFLFLSGLTWPRYAMAPVWVFLGDLVPGTWAVEGFIRINSNAATLAENARPYIALWILCIVYFILAIGATHHVRRKP